MVWGGSGALMHNWGVLDFAGGTAVHINAGVAALAACLILGKRKGYQNTPMPAHNLSLTMAGAAMLWVGWFGFNIGSGGGLNGTSGIVMLNTQLGACAGILGWMFTEWFKVGKPSALGLASGALAGLVGITPACAYVGVGGALAIGVLCGVFCVPSMGGLVAGVTMGAQVLAQLKGVALTTVYCFVVSWIILKVVNALVGLRAHESVEEMGLDLAEHNERAYNH